MIDDNGLKERVDLLGLLPNDEIGEVLQKSHIFFCPSLSEAFCIAILEAAFAGCLVVANSTGGIPEVLPPDIAILSKPTVDDLVNSISLALEKLPDHNGEKNHERLKEIYSWRKVAVQTEEVLSLIHI